MASNSTEYFRKYYAANKERLVSYHAEWAKRNTVERSHYNRRLTYGLEPEQYTAMLESQGGVCAICGRPPAKKSLEVDHDHKSGKVRGLLCWRCNSRLLSAAGVDPARLRRAALYLEQPPAEKVIGEHVVPPRKPRKRRKKND